MKTKNNKATRVSVTELLTLQNARLRLTISQMESAAVESELSSMAGVLSRKYAGRNEMISISGDNGAISRAERKA